ncbi:hypothetical protein BKA82DRAFT_4010089 [Pisolithus tinctorius]|nr:hypothetical protein BKA82DRAFT_4010089 [Pisolithus tinctorius]
MWLTGDQWSFEAIEVVQRRRDEGDSCAELNSSEIRCLRGSANAVQVARVRGWEVAYEKGQQTVGVERRGVAQQYYYEWGERVQYTRERMLTLQRSIKGKEMFDDEGREAAWWMLAMMTGLDEDQQLRKIGSVVQWRQSMMGTDSELNSSSFCFDFKGKQPRTVVFTDCTKDYEVQAKF